MTFNKLLNLVSSYTKKVFIEFSLIIGYLAYTASMSNNVLGNLARISLHIFSICYSGVLFSTFTFAGFSSLRVSYFLIPPITLDWL